MDRVGTLPGKLSIWVYTDHMPPHFHIRSPASNAQVDLRTLHVLRGRASRRDLSEAVAWMSVPANRNALEREWRRLNETV